jgi:hypothetical protein
MQVKDLYVQVKVDDGYMLSSILDAAKIVAALIELKPKWYVRLILGRELVRHIARLARKIEIYEADERRRHETT